KWRCSMTTEAQREQHERQRVFAQDQSLRNQGSTFHQHAQADAQTPRGRFSAVDAAYVVGRKPDVAAAYPAPSSAHQTELPPEPALGYRIDAMPDLDPGPSSAAQGIGDPASDVPSSRIAVPPVSMSERAAGSLPTGDPSSGLVSQPSRHAGHWR